MGGPVAPADAIAAAGGSPTRRRLLALLAGLAAAGTADAASTDAAVARVDPAPAGPEPSADPMLRPFAELRALLDRHAAALARCDAIEARLVAEIGYPRVALPRGTDEAIRYAADAPTLMARVPPGRGRQRRLAVLDARQRRWDAAAEADGLPAAQLAEAKLDTAVLTAADALLVTPAWTLRAVALKLVVLLSLHAPGPAEADSPPWRELRLILRDLGRLAAAGGRA